MKMTNAVFRKGVVFFLVGLACLFGTVLPGVSESRFKLKPGAKGKICIQCHKDFKEILKKPQLHPLLRNGECAGCHDPHTSYHKNLLTSAPTKLCLDCHKAIMPSEGGSAHKIVQEGQCGKCHDPHGSENRYQLKGLGNELCFECHQSMEKDVKNSRFKHRPLTQKGGCLNCHDPHGSDNFDALLQKEAPFLCKKCHQTGETVFKEKHMNYPVADSNCTSCHDPHGSNTRGMLFTKAHIPMVKKTCNDCHSAPSSSDPFATKKQGIALCEQCHEKTINRILDNNRVHWPILDKKGCLHCHSPHGTKEEMLLKGPAIDVCGDCHGDTVELQRWSIDNPNNPHLCEPVKKGDCVACHSPHAADNILLISEQPVGIQLCGRCHEWQTHSTHPIGEKVIDQRNKNLTVECLSCHKACGTANKPAMMPFETVYELCIQCHVDRKR